METRRSMTLLMLSITLLFFSSSYSSYKPPRKAEQKMTEEFQQKLKDEENSRVLSHS